MKGTWNYEQFCAALRRLEDLTAKVKLEERRSSDVPVTVADLGARCLEESGMGPSAFVKASGVPRPTLARAVANKNDLRVSTVLALVEGAGARVEIVWRDGTRSRLVTEKGSKR